VCHVSYSSESSLPAEEGFGASHVLWLQILPPYRDGSRAPHVLWLRICLPTREDSGAPCVLRLQILPPYREGTCVTTTCPTVPCRQWASNLKESLAGLPVSNTHAYISKAPGVRGIIGLKDVRAGSTVSACKTYRQVATVWLQCSVGPIDHSLDTATMQGDPIARRDRTTIQGVHHAVEDIICYS
jgi:hypothetical protein